MPNGEVMDKAFVIGSALVAGSIEAAAYRANPQAGTLATFGGAIGGLLGAMMLRGRLAQIAEGVAASSAGSIGHFAVKAWWPATTLRRAIDRAPRQIPAGVASRYPAQEQKEEFQYADRLI